MIFYETVIRRLYANIRIARYATSEWLDINILRVILMQKYFPFSQHPISVHSRNALITICQKSLHSKDPFVVAHAERLLYEVNAITRKG